jgi:pimeloyl-ACP methyl ester carboxylesterase
MTIMTELHTETAKAIHSPVAGLHCSGASCRQWRSLHDRLSDEVQILLPQFSGPEVAVGRRCDHPFTLAEEAAPIVASLRELRQPVHLVGHSYGGAVALHIARHHPSLVASLCLYEPTAFDLLTRAGQRDRALAGEIAGISAVINAALAEQNATFAAHLFTEFWGGVGAWQALNRIKRNNMVQWIYKAPLDFEALLDEPVGPAISQELRVTLIYGQRTRPQTSRIIDLLNDEIPAAIVREMQGADHMGPFVFRDRVMNEILRHLKQR